MGELLSETWWGKLGWAISLKMTLRGVGWNWKVKNVPDQPMRSKWQFVRGQLIKAFAFYFAFDQIWYNLQSSVYCSPNPPSLFSDTITRQVFFAWVGGLESYLSINMQYPIFAALTVAPGIYRSEDWPPLMGHLIDVVTVRDVWGKFWHQCLRKALNIPYEIMTKVVPIQKGTILSRYSQLYLAFFASALLHHLPAMQGSNSRRFSTLIYFAIQPLAITFEDFVAYITRKAGLKPFWVTRTIGRIWTFAWFSFSLRYGAALQYESGIAAVQQLPSLSRFLAGPRWKNSFLIAARCKVLWNPE
ncbi:membrane bound O-acyl transferase family-domain-containing protein [Bisporella sp. PMI_857]|nr:membrane bound O-acyl transferase family-domain-containing protein [Bisporella sp. PMI_857]